MFRKCLASGALSLGLALIVVGSFTESAEADMVITTGAAPALCITGHCNGGGGGVRCANRGRPCGCYTTGPFEAACL